MTHIRRNLITDENGHRLLVNWHKDKQLFAILTTTKLPTEEDENCEFIDLWLTKDQMLELQKQVNNAVERSDK